MKKPESVSEAIKEIQAELIQTETLYEQAMKDPDRFVIGVHHTWGRWIRNEWDLWAGGPLCDELKGLGITHPDDMSGYLIRRAVRELKGEQIEAWILQSVEESTDEKDQG
jgi:hypothetical protein